MDETMYLMADDFDDLRDYLDAPCALDPEIAALCDDAQTWMAMAAACAQAMGLTVPQGIEAMRRSQTRVHTGYMPEPQRRDVKHRMYRDGVVIRPVGDASGTSWLVRTGKAAA